MHDAKHVANYYITKGKESDSPFTHLQIQKLVYYSQAWMLAFYEEPMIFDDIEVWKYGPVVPAVYHCLSHNKGKPIRETIPVHPMDEQEFSPQQESILEAVYGKYASMTGPELSTMTHRKGTPWHRAKSKGQWYIDNEDMRKYYSRLIKRR